MIVWVRSPLKSPLALTQRWGNFDVSIATAARPIRHQQVVATVKELRILDIGDRRIVSVFERTAFGIEGCCPPVARYCPLAGVVTHRKPWLCWA